jgi:cyclopropane-fatty-acyl-phospholipid synthase
MSVAARTIRAEPAARLPVLGRVAFAALERTLAGLDGGTLAVTLPDGSVRRFGAGPEAGITIASPRLFRRLATRGTLGLGESYTAGEWESDDLVGLLELLFRNAEAAAARHPRLRRVVQSRPRANRRTGPLAARRNIQYHYDLGNELFALFLDETMTYSCAVFEREDEPLADAQRRKLRRVCDRLRLGPDDHVLELGCGWGSFALVAAGEYGARVTGVTISPAQAALARRRVAEADLAGRVEILERDFREVEGRFTKIASIEMVEAIGQRLFRHFFRACDRLLAPGGIACVQTILIPDDRWGRYRKKPDWIERYVFPGCLIPSLSALTRAMTASSRLMVRDVEEIGPHYGETLRRWRHAFLAQVDDVGRLGYDERFVRTWDFYLASCEAGFRTRALRDAQLVLTRSYNETL